MTSNAVVQLIHNLSPVVKTKWAFFRNPTQTVGNIAAGVILYETDNLYCIRVIQVDGNDTYKSRSTNMTGRLYWINKRLITRVEENDELDDNLDDYRALAAVYLLENIHRLPTCKGKYTAFGDRSLWILSLTDLQANCVELRDDTLYWELERIIQWIRREDRIKVKVKGKSKSTAYSWLKKRWATGGIFFYRSADNHSPLRTVHCDEIQALIAIASSVTIPRFQNSTCNTLPIELIRRLKPFYY